MMRVMSGREEWITSREAAEIAKVTTDAVRKMFRRPGASEHSWTPGGHLRIHRGAFVAWLERVNQERRA